MTTTKPHIEVLTFDGCPNAGPAIELVERVTSELAIEVTIERIDVASESQVTELRFLGSPSIRVDGCDIEPGADQRTAYVLSCRVYPSDTGLTGAPDESWLRVALGA